ncbi:oxidoreductase-like protein [Hortaea werneckii]|nr:oxidoreductase-like protein [Hortaea werneckii]
MPTHAPPTHVLHDYYLAITLLITVAYQLIGFSIAFTLKFDKLTDFWGGSNFVILAIITLSMSGTTNARQIVTSIFLIVWASRLAGFLLFRILKTGKDDRFDDKRGSFFKFLGFWVFQMFWVWTVSMPVTILNSPNVLQYRQPSFGKATDIIGIIFWVIAFFTEAISDVQKYRFKKSERGQQPGAVCNVGFFKYSRHPNYFGEIMIQVSIFMIAVTPASYHTVPSSSGAYAALYASMVGWIFLTALLMFVSGLPLQERPGAKKRFEKGTGWPEYEKWLHDTSILFPMPPAIWRNLPVIVKRTVGLELPMYVFDPAKHADQSKAQAQAAEEGRNGQE